MSLVSLVKNDNYLDFAFDSHMCFSSDFVSLFFQFSLSSSSSMLVNDCSVIVEKASYKR